MKKKVLLMFPNTSNEGVMPLAVSILSTIAKEAGAEVRYFETSFYEKKVSSGEDREKTGEFKFVDRKEAIKLLPYGRLKEDFQALLSDYAPDILAVTANSLEYEFFCELIEEVELPARRPFIIVGGVHATVSPEEVIANKFVDALCLGEGEAPWEELLRRLDSGEEISKIQNLWVKTAAGITRNPIGPLLKEEELWKRPLDYSFFDERHFLKPFDGKIYHRGDIELSRGCPYACTYCVNSVFKGIYKGLGKFVRTRPFENLKEGIRREIAYGVEMLYLQDECFLSNPLKVLQDFCKWYGEEVRLPLLVQTRPETVTEERIKLIADMNVPVQISLGVESGSDRILKDICKRQAGAEQIKNAYRIIKKYKLRSTAYTMVGFPTETREEAFETIRLIRELDVDNSIMSIFFPFKGLPLRQFCLEKGYITGLEKARTFTEASILTGQPMTGAEIYNLRRTYSLYTKLPESYFPQIELCEKDFESNRKLFDELVALVNSSYYKSWNLK